MRFILDTRSITTITNFRTIISLKGAFCEPRVAVLTLVTRTHLSSIYARLPKTFINSGHSFSKKQECQAFHRTPITSIKDAYATTNTAVLLRIPRTSIFFHIAHNTASQSSKQHIHHIVIRAHTLYLTILRFFSPSVRFVICLYVCVVLRPNYIGHGFIR